MREMATVKIEVARPDWLESAIPKVEQSLRLMQMPHFPNALKGMFAVGAAMRLLRCVYGSDLDSAVAIRQRVLDDAEFWQKVDAMSPDERKQFFEDMKNAATKG
jgi:hypothetical protein